MEIMKQFSMKPLLILILFLGLCSCHLVDSPLQVDPLNGLRAGTQSKLLAGSQINLPQVGKAPQNSRPNQPRNYALNQRLVKPGEDDYVFSWKWVCNYKVSFDDCQALFYWNDELIAKILPTDKSIHRASYNVKGRNGVNKLRIESLGPTPGYGLIIDDVSIVKKGYGKNYVVNGDFEEPKQNGRWNIYTNIRGWTGHDIEIGSSTIYYMGLLYSQVCQLRGFVNSQLKQNVTLQIPSADEQQESKSLSDDNTFVFSWKWACRQQSPLDGCQGLFYWNDKLIANITPSDYAVHTATYDVKGKNGVNKLKIVAVGTQVAFGLSIDDVSIVKKGTSLNYVVNGDFQTSYRGRQIIYPAVFGWTDQNIRIAQGPSSINRGFTSQVCSFEERTGTAQLNQDIILKIGSGNLRSDRNGQSGSGCRGSDAEDSS